MKGADISGYSGVNLGDSPGGLELAVYLGQSEIVDLLLSKGAGKLSNAPNALHRAVVTENVELLAKLLSNGIVPRKYESPDIAYSLFWWAREKGNPEILKLLKPYEPTQQASAPKAAEIQ